MWFRYPLAIFCLSVAVKVAHGQEIRYSADSEKVRAAVAAGARLVHWVETVRGAGEHIIYVRNVSPRPVRVTSYEIYDCKDLRGRACGVHSPGPLLAPGETHRLIVIDFLGLYGSYRYRLSSAYADSTLADSARKDSTRH